MAAEFNEIIHAPLRLRITGLLRPVKEIDFAVLRDTLGINDVNLSKHLKVLAAAGFISITKTASASRNDSRRITWVALTPMGHRAFDAHIQQLQLIAGGFAGDTAPPSATATPSDTAAPAIEEVSIRHPTPTPLAAST